MIDGDGYRANVGIIIFNEFGKLLWARRKGQKSWQFPQGGIKKDESIEEAMFRELREEVGLFRHHVSIVGQTKNWLRYRIPKHLLRHHCKPLCIGQKQIWYFLEFKGEDSDIKLDQSNPSEFDDWRWVNQELPVEKIVSFKRNVYRKALAEFRDFFSDACVNANLTK